MLKSFEKIESIDECRKIARLASLACFELQPDFENPDAQQLKDLKIASYLLSKITDRNGKILYGFYNVDYTDFLPLNTEETAFAYLEFFLGITVDTKTIEALKELLIADKASVIKSCQRNYDNYLPCKGWIFEQSASDLFIAVQNLFKEPIEQLWICDLSFSTYRLAEYIFFNKEGSRVRNYALFQQEEGKITFFFILKGKSQNIYDVWNENGFSIDTEEKYLDYLKFFTWAIEWNEGKFILPEKIHEMPWESIPPDKGSWNGIRSHLKSKNPQKYKEAGNKIEWDERIDKLKAQGGVIYGNAFFEAWFGINTANGFVRMPFDNALLGELPLKELKFHPQIAISVDEPGKEDAALSGNTFDKDSGTKEAQYTGFNDSECFKGLKNNDLISNQLFQKKLAVKGRVEKKRISKKITIADSIFKQSAVVCSERIEIWDCWFDEEVSLTNCSSGPSILFKNCVFAQKFSANDSFQPKSVSFENCLFNDLQRVNKV